MFQLQPDEGLAEGVRRVALEQADSALEALRAGDRRGADRNEAIHEARKSCKKVRAALRLMRSGLAPALYREQNSAYRDVAQRLSVARDRSALLERVDALSARYGAWLASGALESVRERLVERHEVALDRLLRVERADERAVAELELARLATASLPRALEHEADVVGASVRRVYRSGRRALARAAAQPSTSHFHELRKQVKYLWYHARLLGRRAGPLVATQMSRLEALSRDLGEEHDLFLLRAELRSDRSSTGGVEQLQVLLGVVSQRRAELRAAALASGRRLYAPAPGDVAERLQRAWLRDAPHLTDPTAAPKGSHGGIARPRSAPGGSISRFDPARRRSTP